MVVSLYVGDLIYAGNNDELMMKFKQSMQSEFAMTDLGKMKFFLGLEATQQDDGIFLVSKEICDRSSREIWHEKFKFCS